MSKRKDKIGRNDRCPCGSGKKYKKCCLGKESGIAGKKPQVNCHNIGRLDIMRIDRKNKKKTIEETESLMRKHGLPFDRDKFLEYQKNSWDIDRVSKMKTDEIVKKLESLDIMFSLDIFKEQAGKHISAIKLADEFYYPQGQTVDGWEEDFIMLAIMELWNRFIPERVNIEMLDEEMHRGYDELENGNRIGAMDIWFKAWEFLKEVVPDRIDSIEEADNFFPEPLSQYVSNWCQDLEMYLHNAGREDKTYYRKRIEYCEEFISRFPNSDELIIFNMHKARADTYAVMGDRGTAEQYYRVILKQYPYNEMSYVGWGDLYYWHTDEDNKDTSYKRAEEIYRLGLKKCMIDNEVLLERLENLEEDKKDHMPGDAGAY